MEEIKQAITDVRGDVSFRQFARILGVSAPVICEAEKSGRLSKRLAKKYAALTDKPLEFFIR